MAGHHVDAVIHQRLPGGIRVQEHLPAAAAAAASRRGLVSRTAHLLKKLPSRFQEPGAVQDGGVACERPQGGRPAREVVPRSRGARGGGGGEGEGEALDGDLVLRGDRQRAVAVELGVTVVKGGVVRVVGRGGGRGGEEGRQGIGGVERGSSVGIVEKQEGGRRRRRPFQREPQLLPPAVLRDVVVHLGVVQ